MCIHRFEGKPLPVRKPMSLFWKHSKQPLDHRGTWTHLASYVHLRPCLFLVHVLYLLLSLKTSPYSHWLISELTSSADAEIELHASRWMPPKYQTPDFLYRTAWSSSGEFEITECTIQIGFAMEVAKTPTYFVVCRFRVFALGLYDSPTLQTEGRTSCS